MALRKQYSQLLSDLRAQLGRNNDPGVRASDLAQLQETISQVYEQLYTEYDWPHLHQVFDRIPLAAGQQYYDFPDAMDYDNIDKVAVWFNNQPIAIERGIGFAEYATYDPALNARADPVEKWDVRFVTTKEQMEVWPLPASNNQAVQFIGYRAFSDLVDDADQCLIDDNYVVLTAAQMLDKDKNRLITRARALDRLEAQLKAGSKGASKTVRLGLGAAEQETISRAVVRIAGR